MDLRAVNLNLLLALDALLRERSVSRAAQRMGLSQPAMSNALAQLRELIGDPLLVRAPGGMAPTPRALELAEPLRRALAILEEVVQPPAAFDPARSTASFVLAMSDYAEMLLLPELLRRLSEQAPGVDLQVLPWGLHEVPPGLADGTIDVMVGFHEGDPLPPGHHAEPLLDDHFVCIVRRDHPTVGRRLTLDAYLRLRHVVVTERIGASGVLDDVLARLGKRRRVVARVPRFFMVPYLVAQTDLVAAVDSRVARHYERLLPIRVLKVPLDDLPSGRMGMVWHARSDADPPRRWLRDVLRETARAEPSGARYQIQGR